MSNNSVSWSLGFMDYVVPKVYLNEEFTMVFGFKMESKQGIINVITDRE